jgi:1-acyl-sn-glycerol-3-phosphate acyltransferase
MRDTERMIVSRAIRWFFRVLCKVDDAELDKISMTGPLIVAANHVNSIEVPLIFTHLYPRPVRGLAKVETWDNWLFHYLFNLWRVIPIRRGEADLNAFNLSLQALAEGEILGVMPEGTRSHDGKMQKGLPGVVLLALRSKSAIQPMVMYGHETFWSNLRRLRRTPFHIRVGNPFMLDANGAGLSREVREQMAAEVMYQLAALLPPEYRGLYNDLERATETYLRFAPGIESNLALTMKQSAPGA